MIPPFNRRDSLRFACGLAFILGCIAASIAGQRGASGREMGLSAAVAVCLAFILSAILTRRLPPDMALRPLDDVARREALAPPPAERARLRVAFVHEPLGVSRMDIYLDDKRVGQLRAGMAFVLPVRPGLHVLSARVWLRRLDLRDQINALPGTDSDIAIRASGSKSRSYGVERRGLAALLHDERMILVSPDAGEA